MLRRNIEGLPRIPSVLQSSESDPLLFEPRETTEPIDPDVVADGPFARTNGVRGNRDWVTQHLGPIDDKGPEVLARQ